MKTKKPNPTLRKRRSKENQDFKSVATRQIRKAGLDKEITESLIKEIEEICDFEDSLEEF